MSGSMTSTKASFTTPDGVSIVYTLHAKSPTKSGESSARPRIALIHSLALDQSVWDGVVPLLTEYADVLAYDCRGHGKSGRPKMKFAPELFAADLAGLLDHVNWPSITLAGCSMGGCIAQAFAGGLVWTHRAEGLARARRDRGQQGIPGAIGFSGDPLGQRCISRGTSGGDPLEYGCVPC
jgi:alpha-beta hydrolase superfamily lysophospholipase